MQTRRAIGTTFQNFKHNPLRNVEWQLRLKRKQEIDVSYCIVEIHSRKCERHRAWHSAVSWSPCQETLPSLIIRYNHEYPSTQVDRYTCPYVARAIQLLFKVYHLRITYNYIYACFYIHKR